MAAEIDIATLGDQIAAEITAAESALPNTIDMGIIRPRIMRGLARGLASALDPPWTSVGATNSSNPEAAKLAPGWLNYGSGWALAMTRKTPLTRTVQLRGYVTTAGSNTLILTLPPLLRPAQNELFATVIDFQPAYINVWVDGTVSVYYAEATTRQAVTLSGISWEALY